MIRMLHELKESLPQARMSNILSHSKIIEPVELLYFITLSGILKDDMNQLLPLELIKIIHQYSVNYCLYCNRIGEFTSTGNKCNECKLIYHEFKFASDVSLLYLNRMNSEQYCIINFTSIGHEFPSINYSIEFEMTYVFADCQSCRRHSKTSLIYNNHFSFIGCHCAFTKSRMQSLKLSELDVTRIIYDPKNTTITQKIEFYSYSTIQWLGKYFDRSRLMNRIIY